MSKSATSNSSGDPWHVDLSDKDSSDSDAVKIVSSPPKGYFVLIGLVLSYATLFENIKMCTVGKKTLHFLEILNSQRLMW